jgi:hypothetical protein
MLQQEADDIISRARPAAPYQVLVFAHNQSW